MNIVVELKKYGLKFLKPVTHFLDDSPVRYRKAFKVLRKSSLICSWKRKEKYMKKFHHLDETDRTGILPFIFKYKNVFFTAFLDWREWAAKYFSAIPVRIYSSLMVTHSSSLLWTNTDFQVCSLVYRKFKNNTILAFNIKPQSINA